MGADYTPTLGNYTELKPFRYWCQKVLPLVYDDSLSYYELLCKVVDYLNKTMEDVEVLHDDVEDLHDAYEQLQSFVNDYFDNLDVQEEINNKLDAMVTDGTFDTLLAPYMQHYQNELNVMKGRIDVLETNYDAGGTTADAELADIRVAYNSEVYDSAGDAVRAITERNANEILNINAKTDMTNYVDSLGFDHTKLNNDGTETDNDDWITTDYIPVDSQVWYVTEIPNWAQNYTLLRATYDSNKNFIAYVSINAPPSPRDYVPPFGTAYVKFSVSKTAYDLGFKFREKYNIFDDIDTREDGIERTVQNINDVLHTEDLFLKYGVVMGKLNSSGVLTDNTGFRTSDYIPVEDGAWYVTGSYNNISFTLFRATYDSSKNFIAYVDFPHAAGDRIFVPPIGTAYIRYTVSASAYESGFYFKKLDNTISSMKRLLAPEAPAFKYTGTALDIEDHKSYNCYKMLNTVGAPAGKTGQGMAVYGKYLFQFWDSDLCMIYDMSQDGRQIAQFTMTCGHGNSAVFSDDFYDNSDPFPLLYISDINGKVYVTRITTSSATTVKTLYFNPSNFGANPQLALGDGDYAYVVGNTSGTDYLTSAKVSKCNLANQTQNQDNTYTPEVIDSFNLTITEEYPVLQGVNYLNGHLYISSGGFAVTVLSRIFVVDLESESIVTIIEDFPYDMSVGELEDIAFIRNPLSAKYDILAHIRTVGYYRLVF